MITNVIYLNTGTVGNYYISFLQFCLDQNGWKRNEMNRMSW